MLVPEMLRTLLGLDAVLVSEEEMGAFTEDWRGRYQGPATCVVLPSNTAQVAEVVRLCAAHRVPVLAQGGNTSLCGGSVPFASGEPPVIVNLQRMRRIRSVDPVNNTMTVDAGCILAAVQEAAETASRLFPISLGAEGSCQVGGIIATNAGGTGVLRYGNTRENVLGLEVVLPDGEIWDGLYGLRKNNTGYDLKHLFIGSEGTLGIVTGAVLKLHPLPATRSVAWLAVPDVATGVEVLDRFRSAHDSRLTAFELMNELQLALVLENVPGRRCPVADPSGCHVLVELADSGEPRLLDAAMQDTLERAMEAGLVTDAALAASDAQRAAMWEVRHSVSEANKKGGVGLTTDCALPVSAVAAFIEGATEAVRVIAPDLPVVIVTHLGDGNVHFIPFFSFLRWEELADRDGTAARIRRAVADVSVSLGGTFSAEHGIGRTLTADMALYKPAAELVMMRAVKRLLDPQGLFNPGKLLPPEARSRAA